MATKTAATTNGTDRSERPRMKRIHPTEEAARAELREKAEHYRDQSIFEARNGEKVRYVIAENPRNAAAICAVPLGITLRDIDGGTTRGERDIKDILPEYSPEELERIRQMVEELQRKQNVKPRR